MIKQLLFFIVCIAAANAAEVNDVLPDPYPEVYERVTLMPFNNHGWYPHAQRFDHLIREHGIKNVIEVGSWLGCSTRHLASLIPADGKVLAVDHWEGSVEHLQMDVRDWLPTLYEQFLSNVIHAGLQDKIIPVRLASLEAAQKLQTIPLKIDLVYIDGAHDYQSVYNDIVAWYPFIADDGIMTGDDWHYGDVKMAVDRFARENNLTVIGDNNFWMYQKSHG